MVWNGVLESDEYIVDAFKFMSPKQPLMVATCEPNKDIDAAICESRFHCSFPNTYRVTSPKTRFETISEPLTCFTPSELHLKKEC